jgi:transcriptional regulator with XRE-family HTH domain
MIRISHCSAMSRKPNMKSGPIRRRAADIDRHVGARMRERRIMLGLTMEQLAELVGVTVQQVGKYETRANRVASGRLYQIARALDVGIGYFFEGLSTGDMSVPVEKQRLLLELTRNFMAIPNRMHQGEIMSLARVLAEPVAGAITASEPRRRRLRTSSI